MKTLIFITSGFPFGTGETFIESEFPYLYSTFGKIIIIARNVKSTKTRAVPEDVRVLRYNPSSDLTGYLRIPGLIIKNSETIISLIKDESRFRADIERRLKLRQKLFLFKSIVKSLQFKNYIENVINSEAPGCEIVLYSYWMNIGARSICMLEKVNGIKIARAHRIDLYEGETKHNYIPLLKYKFLNLNAVFFISEHGKNYFESLSGLKHSKNQISRLGIINTSRFNPSIPESTTFRIVSCSSLTKVKRVHLIISALEKVNSSKRIIWNHFGTGPLKNDLDQLAREKLGKLKGLDYNFGGHIPNTELMKFYGINNVALFINTSSSEGIPVSIMEAQSFGIPVIATDAGGTSEIVKENTGILLPVDFEINTLIYWIEYYINMIPDDRIKHKTEIYNNWKSFFNASTNYPEFIQKVSDILVSGNNETFHPV